MTKITFTPEQVAELLEAEAAKIQHERDREKFNEQLNSLLVKARKKGFHLNKKMFCHMLPEVERFCFLDYEMMV